MTDDRELACEAFDTPDAPPASSQTAVEPVALAYSGECIDIAREAFDAWASKPHNKRWFKRIDGTPIINDIIVNMAVTFGAHGVIAKRAPSDLMVPLSALTAQAAALEAAEREAATLKARIAELEADTSRLDFLDDLNARLNAASGTVYRWEMVINHNVNRLMMNFPRGVDLNDAKAHGFPSCREAIDREMCRIIASRRARRLTHQEKNNGR